ncbi:hypothetical protein SEVIR_1G318150v4 [Setaria viridis]
MCVLTAVGFEVQKKTVQSLDDEHLVSKLNLTCSEILPCPVVDVEPCAGDQPVPRAVLRPHGHLRGVRKPQHLLRGHRHGRPAGEHARVDVDGAAACPVNCHCAAAGRPRGGHGRMEARLPGQPRRAARPPGLPGQPRCRRRGRGSPEGGARRISQAQEGLI